MLGSLCAAALMTFAACTGGNGEPAPPEPEAAVVTPDADVATDAAPQEADTLAVRDLVDGFFAQYVAQVDSAETWVDASPVLTPAFKQAYTQLYADAQAQEMGLDSDPVLNAQDVPAVPYKTRTATISGDRATAEVTNAEWADALIRVSLVNVNGEWRIDGINDINPGR